MMSALILSLYHVVNKIVFWPGGKEEKAQVEERTKQATRKGHESQGCFIGRYSHSICGKKHCIVQRDSCVCLK